MSEPPPLVHSLLSSARISITIVPSFSNSMEDSTRLQFLLKIVQKLDEKNVHLWHQQTEPYINAQNLTEFMIYTRILPQFVTDEDRTSGTLNP